MMLFHAEIVFLNWWVKSFWDISISPTSLWTWDWDGFCDISPCPVTRRNATVCSVTSRTDTISVIRPRISLKVSFVLRFEIWRVCLDLRSSTPCFIKTTPYLIAYNFGKCWPISNFFFTLRVSSDCVMKWPLKIPSSHLKRVDTLPCKTLMFQNWSN